MRGTFEVICPCCSTTLEYHEVDVEDPSDFEAVELTFMGKKYISYELKAYGGFCHACDNHFNHDGTLH